MRQLRLRRGLTQEGLAELVGNTEKHVGLVERGAVNVSIDVLVGLAAHLSVDVAELFAPSPSDSDAPRAHALTPSDLDLIERALQVVRRARRGDRRRARTSA